MEPIKTPEQLVARFENSKLDFKTTYDLARDDIRYEIAKDVAAFANAIGGAIVVGIKEQPPGRIASLEDVVDRPRLMRTVADALRLHCMPVPTTPEEHPIMVSPAIAVHLLARGAQIPTEDLTLVTLNMQPDPRGPIGVKPHPLAGITDAYRFPVRVADQTRFMPPTELPMWMNSHERRIALRLRAITEGSRVRVFGHGDQNTPNLVGVDEERSIAIFALVGAGTANVPLAFIEAVWPEPHDEVWSIKIQGRIFRDQEYAFRPRQD